MLLTSGRGMETLLLNDGNVSISERDEIFNLNTDIALKGYT